MMKNTVQMVAIASTMCLMATTQVVAQTSTKVMVRVTARDAKILGSGVGGARVVILDAETGDTLAAGTQEGSTGNTTKIMVEPRVRGESVYDTEGAAGFLADLALTEPTPVIVIGEGPLATPHAMQRTTKTMLLLPGEDVLGDGVILELLGFTVVLDAPADGSTITAGHEFEITANVTMLCGCPTQPGGLWDADHISVVARLLRDGSLVTEVPLRFAGTTSTYSARATVREAGSLEIRVFAKEGDKGNFGTARRFVEVR